MTANEFKSWLDGYMEGRKGPVSKKELELIHEKAQELSDGQPWPTYSPFWISPPWTPTPHYQPPTWICETTSASAAPPACDYVTVSAGTSPYEYEITNAQTS